MLDSGIVAVKAKHQLPQLSFDIYGRRRTRKIKNIITKHRAEDYIQIKGHRNLRTICIFIHSCLWKGWVGLGLLVFGCGLWQSDIYSTSSKWLFDIDRF